jgi:hypothetical protein
MRGVVWLRCQASLFWGVGADSPCRAGGLGCRGQSLVEGLDWLVLIAQEMSMITYHGMDWFVFESGEKSKLCARALSLAMYCKRLAR